MTLVRRAWIVTAVAALALAGWAGYAWARDLSLLRIRDVSVSGVGYGREANAIRRALEQTGKRMTILHVREQELEEAVDSFTAVRSLSVSTDFPSTLRVEVQEHVPAAALTSPGGRRVAVSRDGVMLRGLGSKAKLPSVAVSSIPGGRELEPSRARVLVSALGAAPDELRPLLSRAYVERRGIRVSLREGPVVELGPPRRLAAKWAAAARVLADPGSSGAGVIDVRLPERPAAVDGPQEGEEPLALATPQP